MTSALELAAVARILALLNAHPDGMRPQEIAHRVDSSVRTVYRDLRSIEGELGMPLWSEGGRWGIEAEAFLPPLKLTRSEAMAVVLSARLMVRYADTYDPDLAAAFEKLAAILPPALREHVDRTLDDLSRRADRRAFSRHVRPADPGLGRAPDRLARLRAGALRAGGGAADGPRPAVPDRAVAHDPRPLPDRLGRDP